jgi:Na+/H+ antiporter NhaD/arsenite permease-like protein
MLITAFLSAEQVSGHGDAHAPPFWGLGVLPFVAILAAIALLPLIRATHRWWESNLNRLGVALGCGGLTLLYYALSTDLGTGLSVVEHAITAEYVPFMTFLFSLYVISGGISLKGDLPAHPLTNTAFLAAGAVIANLIGTTGASMLLIRPLLQTNSERRRVVHTIVFFMFLVSNVAGCLLPIGDPPLFIGFLYGVPFFWTLRLWPEWLACSGVLLAAHHVWDTIEYRREVPRDILRDEAVRQPLRLRGGLNALWLAGVVATVALVSPRKTLPLIGVTPFPFLRELILLALVAASWFTTDGQVRRDNRFHFAAIAEVAALFIGIFIAMQVPVQVLEALGPDLTRRGLDQPWHFFWATGSLSSFLDNAPTYVVFLKLATTMAPQGPVVTLADGSVVSSAMLAAVSLGAVFMGAMTYIGNGPNFMVKAIAEQAGVPMPTFLGYMFRYSIPILLPLFALTVIFLL